MFFSTGVKLLLKGCGSPTELMAEIQIPVSRQVDQDATLSNTMCPADCVRWGPSSPPQQGGTAAPLLFGPCVLWPNGCMDQDATWYGCRPRPRPRDVRWDLAPPNKGARQPMSIVAMQTAGRRYRGIGLSRRDVVLDSPSTESGTAATPLFDPLCSGTVPSAAAEHL